MQYNVPQFVEQEAKIIGPFNLRDFFIVFGSGLLSAIAFFTFQLWLAIIFALIISGGTIAMIMVRINGRPLYNIALAAIHFFWAPRLYLWKKEGLRHEEMLREIPIKKPVDPALKADPEKSAPKILTPEKIQELVRQLDLEEPPSDISLQETVLAEKTPASTPQKNQSQPKTSRFVQSLRVLKTPPSSPPPSQPIRPQRLTPEKIKALAQQLDVISKS